MQGLIFSLYFISKFKIGSSIKTTFHVHIGSVKFATQFKESPCSTVATFPRFGSEGHGVEFAQVDSFCRGTLRQGAGDSTSKGRVCSFTG